MQFVSTLKFNLHLLTVSYWRALGFLGVAIFLVVGFIPGQTIDDPIKYLLEYPLASDQDFYYVLPLFLAGYACLSHLITQLKPYFYQRWRYEMSLSFTAFLAGIVFSVIYGLISFVFAEMFATGHERNLLNVRNWQITLFWILIVGVYLIISALIFNCLLQVINHLTVAIFGTIVILGSEMISQFIWNRSYLLDLLPNRNNYLLYLSGRLTGISLVTFSFALLLVLMIQHELIRHLDW